MNRFTQKKTISKSVLSILVPVVVFFAVFFLFLPSISSISATTEQEETENLKQAVIRSTIYCYAVEGAYPESLSYLEDHYGITYDHSKYIISYEVHASNLMPDITVISLSNKGGTSMNKKKTFYEQTHATDLLFSLGLLCLFTISALTVLLIGAHVYKQTALDMKTNYTTRTALTYVAEKVRQHDSADSISLGTIEDVPALELVESIDGVSYITYIYEDENALKELFVQESQRVTKSQGETILAVQNFSMEQAGKNLLRFTVTDEENTSASLLIHLRSNTASIKGGTS